MSGFNRGGTAALLTFAALGLWACGKSADAPARSHAADQAPASSGRGDSGYASRDSGSSGGYSSGYSSGYSGGYSGGSSDRGYGSSYDREEEPRAPVPLVDGKPMWSDNRRHSAEDNADYHFHRDGPDFGADSVKDYVAKAHAFIEHPPGDVESVSRSNGDKLFYDPKTNTFAVARKDGAPRTMFKPRDGEAYWKAQQAKAASGEDSYGGRSRRQESSGDQG